MADRKPSISICIANYNGEKVLADCLDSLRRQEIDHDFEVIVHDDASTDDSVDLIHRCYPDVKLLKSDQNVGFCVSNNKMVTRTSGEFILLLNNDATLQPNALSVLMEHAKSDLRKRILTLPQYDMTTRALIDVGRKVDISLNPVPQTKLRTGDVAMCIGACLWIPRDLWTELEGFPEWFDSIGEDLFLCLAAWRAGYGVTAIGESGYYHHIGHSFGGGKLNSEERLSSPMPRRRLSEVNRIRTLAILMPSPVRWIILPLNLLMLASEGLLISLFLARPQLWTYVYWPAMLTLFRDRHRLRSERRRLGKFVRAPFSRLLPHFTWFPYKLRMLLRYGLPRVTH